MIGLLLLACAPAAVQIGEAPAPPASEDPASEASGRVVIVVLDGARVDETFADGTTVTGASTDTLLPVVRAHLWPAGTRVDGALNTGVPITTESHTELFTGLRQDLATLAPGEGTTYKSDVPTLFELVRHARGLDAGQVPLIVNTVLVEDLAWSAWPGLGEAWGGTHRFRTDDEGVDLDDPVVLDDLTTWLGTHDVHLAYANLHAIDLTAHDGVAADYEERVRAVDEPLAGLWDWLQSTPGYAGNTTLVVLADHGRHAGEDWSGHGDQCLSCRSIPLFFAGPGIREGAVVEADATLADVARTVAFQLGLDLPLSRGRVLREIFEVSPPIPAPGAYDVAAVGAHLAVAGPGVLAGGTRGMGVAIDRTLVSTPGARHAEAPVLVEQEGALVTCWRELVVGDTASWAGRCVRDGVDLAFPEASVSARWAPSLVADGADLWVAYTDNPNGYTGAENGRVRVVRLGEEGWVGDEDAGPSRSIPTRPSIVRVGGDSIVAFASSSDEIAGRDDRTVQVWRVQGDAEQTWTHLAQYAPDGTWGRFEGPVLRADGRAVAMFGYGATTSVLLGEAGALVEVDDRGRALPHLGLAWVGDTLVWARLSAAGTVEVCRAGDTVSCTDLGSAAVTGLAPTEDGGWAVVDGEVRRFSG